MYELAINLLITGLVLKAIASLIGIFLTIGWFISSRKVG